MEDEINDVPESNDKFICKNSLKRSIGMIDPDYCSSPDPKHVRLLEQEGQEELCNRVIRVVEKNFLESISDEQKVVEDVDERILQLRQALHTKRYCISLDFYALGKAKNKSHSDFKQELHPTVRRHVGKAPHNNSEKISIKQEHPSDTKLSLPKIESTDATNPHTSTPKFNQRTSFELLNTSTPVSQGRQTKLQSKKRVVVGNTYQYLSDEGSSNGQSLKFKWRIYVRGAEGEPDISGFVSSVTFTLDRSYSPHDVITIKQPPFVLSRRGWGEFKAMLKISFVCPLDKPIQLLHSLTLGRVDDPLAFCGIWRLGKETWYDITVYDKWKEIPVQSTKCEEESESISPVKGNSPTVNSSSNNSLVKNMQNTGTNLFEVDGNVTVSHNVVKSEPIDEFDIPKTVSPTDVVPLKTGVVELPSPNIFNGEKMCKIQVRQANGKLVPLLIPANMYSAALKLAENGDNKKTDKSSSNCLNVSINGLPNNNVKKIPLSNGMKNSIKLSKINILSKSPSAPQARNVRLDPSVNKATSDAANLTSLQSGQRNIIRLETVCNETKTNEQSEKTGSTVTTTTVGSNSIRLTPASISTRATKLIKTPEGNKFLITSTFPSDKKICLDKKSIVNGVYPKNDNNIQILKQNLPTGQQEPMFLQPNKIIFASNLANVKNKNVPVPIPRSTVANGSSVTKDPTKITTRRIFISAPPHLVKLKAEASMTNQTPLKTKIKPQLKNGLVASGEATLWTAYENRLSFLREKVHHCKTVDEVLHFFMKGLPLVKPTNENGFYFATTDQEFLKWPIGKQRAVEFWQSRKIKEELERLSLPGWKEWNSLKIVSWAKRHAYTPYYKKPYLLTEKYIRTAHLVQYDSEETSSRTISDVSLCDLEENTSLNDSTSSISISPEKTKKKNNTEAPVAEKDYTDAYAVVPLPEDLDASFFISSNTTKRRVTLQPETIFPGVKMDLAKAALWKATQNFMENLLRSSHAAAFTTLPESNVSKALPDGTGSIHGSLMTTPSVIEVKDVKSAIAGGRPQFQMLTLSGLGAISGNSWELDLKKIKEEPED